MTYEERVQFNKQQELKAIIALPEGRRFLWRLLGETGFRSQPFTNSGHTAFNLGRKSVADKLFDRLIDCGKEAMISVLYAPENDMILISEMEDKE